MQPGSTLYLAGPMRSMEWFNFPAFDRGAAHLRAQGFKVISPAELDRQMGLDPFKLPDDFDWTSGPEGFCLADAFRRDVDAVFNVDGVAVLYGWYRSRGASLEVALACFLSKPVVWWDTLEPVQEADLPTEISLGREAIRG